MWQYIKVLESVLWLLKELEIMGIYSVKRIYKSQFPESTVYFIYFFHYRSGQYRAMSQFV